MIINFLEEKIGISEADTLSGDENLLVDGTLDSVSIMRLIAHIEERLELKVPPRDLLPKNFMTLDAMVAYLSARRAPSQPS